MQSEFTAVPSLSLRTSACLICSRSADSLVFITEVSNAAMSQTGKPKQRDEETLLFCCQSPEHNEGPGTHPILYTALIIRPHKAGI